MHFPDATLFLDIWALNFWRKKESKTFFQSETLPKSLMLKAEMLCLTWYIFFNWILDFYRHAMYLKHALCQNRLLVWGRKSVLLFQCIGISSPDRLKLLRRERDCRLLRVLRQGEYGFQHFCPIFFLSQHLFIFNYCPFSRSQLLPKVQAKNKEKREESPAPVSLHLSFQTCGGSHSVWHLRSLPCWSAKSSENIAERKKGTEKSSEGY